MDLDPGNYPYSARSESHRATFVSPMQLLPPYVAIEQLKLTPEMNSFENLPLTVSPAQFVG
jgi:hypothetical protein